MERKWLKDIRESKKMKQKAVAEAIGIAQGYYADIENGRRCEPDKVDTEKAIAKFLGFDWTMFFEPEIKNTG